jgi:hypothetical protein
MIDSGLQIRWKKYQSAKSEAQVLLINVPPVLDRGRVESKIIWHLSKIEKRFLKKRTLPTKFIVVPLPKIKVLWRW